MPDGFINRITKGAAHAEARRADVTKDEDLHLIDSWTAEVDAVVSMLPYLYHAICAKFGMFKYLFIDKFVEMRVDRNDISTE